MSVCTFFGHGDAPDAITDALKAQIIYLIEHKSVNKFYVGNHGHFDFLVRKVLNELKLQYQFIDCLVVLAYLPKKKDEFDLFDYSKTIYPEGIESAPPRFAIDRRNKWMIEKSDFVITYVNKVIGGAYKYKEISIKKSKNVIELSSADK